MGYREIWEQQEAKKLVRRINNKKITEKAKEMIPLKKISKHPWWDAECDDAMKKRKKAYLNYNSKKSQGYAETERSKEGSGKNGKAN